jgi:hypothetical protein
MQGIAIFIIRLFHLTLEYNPLVKAKLQMHNNGTNQEEDNNCKCKNVYDQAKHIIPRLSLLAAHF